MYRGAIFCFKQKKKAAPRQPQHRVVVYFVFYSEGLLVFEDSALEMRGLELTARTGGPLSGTQSAGSRAPPSDAWFTEDTLVGVGVEWLAHWRSTLATLEALVVVSHLLPLLSVLSGFSLLHYYFTLGALCAVNRVFGVILCRQSTLCVCVCVCVCGDITLSENFRRGELLHVSAYVLLAQPCHKPKREMTVQWSLLLLQ
jgi:hypothetical protein